MNLLLALIAIVTMNQSPASRPAIDTFEDGSGRAVIAVTDDGRTYNQGGRGAGTVTQIVWCVPGYRCAYLDGPNGPEYAGPSLRVSHVPSAPVVSPFLYIGQ